MMETTSSSFNIEFEDYSDFEEKFIKNKFLIKEFLEKKQADLITDIKKSISEASDKNNNINIITKFFYFEDYIGLFLHKITGNEKELKQIISYVNNLIKLKKEKEGEEYSGMLDNTDIIDLQFFLNKESYYDSKILKDLNINYQQLSKQPQIYNLN